MATAENDEIRQALSDAVAHFLKRTRTLRNLILVFSALLFFAAGGLLWMLLQSDGDNIMYAASEAPVLALLTLSINRVNTLSACEFDCAFLEVRFLAGGRKALLKALDRTLCRDVQKVFRDIGGPDEE